MGSKYFSNIDFYKFWNDSEYSLKEYLSDPATEEIIKATENELGYRLPVSYIELMKLHNGGMPVNTCFPTKEPTSWAKNHIAISGIIGIGSKKSNSLCGAFGNQFMIEEWGYPDLGIVICDCPSAGHDVVMLDYRKCGKDGEPEVVHVDQDCDYKVTFLAKDFETFICGLVNEKKFN